MVELGKARQASEVDAQDAEFNDVSLARSIRHATTKALLKLIGDGSWLQPNWNARVVVPAEILIDIWKMVDIEAVKTAMRDRLQAELADRVVNHMAAEIATDIKQILSVKERREALRSVVRLYLDDIVAGKAPDGKPTSPDVEFEATLMGTSHRAGISSTMIQFADTEAKLMRLGNERVVISIRRAEG